MPDQTSNLALPYLAAGQAQKHVTVNEALRRLDATVQLSVVSAATTVEPGSPSDGAVYIVPSGKTGTHWASFANWSLGYYRDGAWEQITPHEGWLAFAKDTDKLLYYTGSAWTELIATRVAKAGDIMTGQLNFTLNGGTHPAALTSATAFSEVGRDGGTRLNSAVSAGSIVWQAARCNNALASPTALGAGDYVSVIPQARGHDGSNWSGSQGGLAFRTINAWSGSDHSIELVVFTTPGSSTTQVESFLVGNGVKVGNPSGGYKGFGSLNAQEVRDDDAVLSCYPFDAALDGRIDQAKWDAKVPDRQHPAEFVEDLEAGADGEPMTVRRLVRSARTELRTHVGAARFARRLGGDMDPLTLDGYARHWQMKRHLTSMPNEAQFDPVADQLSLGGWVQRLVETVEIQAILIEQLNARDKALSTRLEVLETC